MFKKHLGVFFGVSVMTAACAVAPADLENSQGVDQPDSISADDDPTNLIPGASSKLADNITSADIGKTIQVTDDKIPYPDTYWPFVDDGIDARWKSSNTASPLEKYMGLVDAANLAKAQAWEQNNHGSKTPDVQDWWGHCPGWTGAATSNSPILHAVYVKADGNGGVATCTAGSTGCVKLEIGDVNALMAEVYVDGDSNFIGDRCDVAPAKIKRDKYGRIARDGSGCKGLNAGAMLIVLGNQIKKKHLPFAIDAQNEANTDQIWNQPAYGYKVYKYETLTTAQAANLVATGKRTGTLTSYSFNTSAKGFVFVDIGLLWVTEEGPNTKVVSGLKSTNETRLVAVIELSAAPTSATAKIIGGEYLDDKTAGANRLRNAPFAWISTGIGPEKLATTVDGESHNPYVKPSVVKQLIALGTK